MNDVAMADFGYQRVSATEKTRLVTDVFRGVADNYDLMNDLMSLGVHRLWKRFAIAQAAIRPNDIILDIAAGSGDLSRQMAQQLDARGYIVVSDINAAMLNVGRDRLQDQGLVQGIHYAQASAEQLPFADNHFSCLSISFGLRNVTDKAAALRAMYRVLQPGGRLLILEFSRPTLAGLRRLYDEYSFKFLPKLGRWVADQEEAYRYLVESIRMHPDQETLQQMLFTAGFDHVDYHNLSGGIVALHKAYKY